MIVYDSGSLIAADRSDRAVWARHKAFLEASFNLITTAPVVAEVSRTGARQAQLHRFLRGCELVAFAVNEAHGVGDLLHRTGTSDVVDAHVMLTASRRNAAEVRTSDPRDIRKLADHVEPRPRIQPP